jgi:hypothetical protein
MATDTLLPPGEVKDMILDLNMELTAIALQVEHADRRRNAIQAEIACLQRQCRHPGTTERIEMDVAESKMRNYCTTCGKQV